MMIDGRTTHGGLSDRLRGCASVFGYCQEKGIPFYIHHTYPFPLEEYLVPNTINWQISDAELTYNTQDAQPIILMLHLIPLKLHRFYLNHLFRHQEWKHKQFHIYSNTLIDDKHYANNYQNLFRPVDCLHKAVSHNCAALGGKEFIAVVLRFQQLLGDFEEGNYPILPTEQAQALIEKCLKKISELHTHEKGEQILVTSDSCTFLRAACNRFPYVHIISGKVVHMDYTTHAGYQTYMKSFIDMLTLSHARKIYLLRTGDMYKSGFAFRAAAINDVPYAYVEF